MTDKLKAIKMTLTIKLQKILITVMTMMMRNLTLETSSIRVETRAIISQQPTEDAIMVE